MTYSKISYQKRIQLIKLVLQEKYSIKKASETLDIKLSTAKQIVRKYRNKGRITKKRSQNSTKQSNDSILDENEIEQDDNQRINQYQEGINKTFNYQQFWYCKMMQQYYQMQMSWPFSYYQPSNFITQF